MNEEIKLIQEKKESYARLMMLSSSSSTSVLSKLSYLINRRSASSTILDKFSERETTFRTPLPVVVRVLEDMISYETK